MFDKQLSGGLLNAAPDAIVIGDAAGRVAIANARAVELFGYPLDEVLGRSVDDLVPGVHAASFDPAPLARPLRGLQLTGHKRSGVEFPVEVSLSAFRADAGVYVIAVMRDITERRRAERTQTLLASIVQSSHDAIISMDLNARVLSWNPGADRLYGYTEEYMLGESLEPLIPPGRRGDEREVFDLVVAGGRIDRYRTQRLRRDGTVITVALSMSPLTDGTGAVIGAVSTARDLSERERSEARFQALLDTAPDAILGVAEDGRIVLANVQAEQMLATHRFDLLDLTIADVLPDFAKPEDRPDEGLARLLTAHRPDGGTLPTEVTIGQFETDEGWVTSVVIRDITERVRNEEEQQRLRAVAERERLEAQLLRTQRLESLGQLAGGVAHDFNNLLAVIGNYGAFIAEEPTSETTAEDAAQIVRAVQRGSDLTRQLLAFARREVSRPQVLDLNLVVTEVEQMLRRSIGEHVRLHTRLDPDLPAVTADPGQLEQVLVNLAVNARDAMSQGGKLTIETQTTTVDEVYAATFGDLPPGRYVRLRVSDTGSGMPQDVVDRAFEPFYTTKPGGQGTGLGLATVYGIITQAGGAVRIYSEPGLGTTINIQLPATDERPADRPSADTPVPLGNGETVLVVEDEPALLQVTRRILASAGYNVLPAGEPRIALELARTTPDEITLLLSDVVMPGMLGRELAAKVTALRPACAVLFVSGYARPVLASQGTLDPGVALLEKPFTRDALLLAVRRRLDLAAVTPLPAAH